MVGGHMNMNRSTQRTQVTMLVFLLGIGPFLFLGTRVGLAQATLPDPPEGEGWRSVNPQPLPPSQTQPLQPLFSPAPNPYAPSIQGQPSLGSTQFDLQSSLVRAGEVITATAQTGQTLYISPGQTVPFDMVLNSPLQDPQGNVVVPAGSTVQGQFQPAQGGTQFVTQSLLFNGRSYPLFAQSNVIPSQRDPRQTSGQAIVEDAFIGAAAGALLGGIFGNRVISTEKVLGGAAAGAVIGNVTAPEAAVVQPNASLALTLVSDFQLQ